MQADATWSLDVRRRKLLLLNREREAQHQVQGAMDMDGGEVDGDVQKRCYVRSRVSAGQNGGFSLTDSTDSRSASVAALRWGVRCMH